MFSDCKALTEVVIPDSVTSIRFSAFYNCQSLTSLTIPRNVTSFGEEVFDSCPQLTLTVYKGSYAQQYCERYYPDIRLNVIE